MTSDEILKMVDVSYKIIYRELRHPDQGRQLSAALSFVQMITMTTFLEGERNRTALQDETERESKERSSDVFNSTVLGDETSS